MKKTETKKYDIAKAGVISGLLIGLVIGGFILFNAPSIVDEPIVAEPLENKNEHMESWHTVSVWNPDLTPLGEVADPGGDGTGFASIFLLNYTDYTPGILGDNTTTWNNHAGVYAYADTDSFSNDTPSEAGFYIVVRARFTKAVCYDGSDSQFVGNRTKCTITFSGDESDTITHYGNHTEGTTGGGICSDNDSGHASLWVNFYFEDNDDGYRLTDDGTLTVSLIEISAKY